MLCRFDGLICLALGYSHIFVQEDDEILGLVPFVDLVRISLVLCFFVLLSFCFLVSLFLCVLGHLCVVGDLQLR